MKNVCFVIQRFDKGRYDQLYEQVFKLAISNAGFTPYRVDQDPSASIPIESIEREIADASACFVELSEDAPNVWFELGYAIAKDKPLCLVCSSVRSKFPFDVQHRQIIHYSASPLPIEYEDLRNKIEERLRAVLAKDVTLQENTDVAKALALTPSINGLRNHELMALIVLFEDGPNTETTSWMLRRGMERSGFAPFVSSLAVSGLLRLGLVKARQSQDNDGNAFQIYSVTEQGEGWLLENQDDLNLHLEKPGQKTNQGYATDQGISDDDIPF